MEKSVVFEKYTVDILLYLLDEGKAPRSRFNGLKGEYNLIIDRLEELVDMGFIKKEKPDFGNVKAIYRLTEEGNTLAEEIRRINQLAIDLSKNE